jgi:hypothetical protein
MRRFAALPARPNWVGLADIRDELGEDFNRHEVDAALKRMALADAVISSMADQKPTGPTDRDSAVHIGNQPTTQFTSTTRRPATPSTPNWTASPPPTA